jgi:hypothetical protein
MSTAFKSCNIVLFPSAVVEQQAIEWSRSVSRCFKTRYVLDAQTCHPHITLYQAHYPTHSMGRPNRRLAVAQFVDSRGQSRLSDVWQSSMFNDKGLGWARQLRPIALSISR